ncbi:MAG TPA: nucleotide-binding protein [Vicinamibacteria bacterium]|nr:nucleotide-binding protein [Vicinamibacteria bacterium]
MRLALLIAPAILTTACSAPPAPVNGNASSLAASRPTAVPAAQAPAPETVSASQASAPAPQLLTGIVADTMDSGGYTYVLVRSASGEAWAAVQQTPVKKGAAIAIEPSMVMENFESKTLHRKFARIVFGSLAGVGTPSAAGGQDAAPHSADNLKNPAVVAAIQAAHREAPAAAPLGDVRVDKAQGKDARTVSEVFAQRGELNDKPVAVRGKVVKFLPGIMGRNWLHLRDGSGSAAAKDDDLAVTTAATAAVGEVVLVRGTAHSDRDFGAGYRYPVIVEDATVSR